MKARTKIIITFAVVTLATAGYFMYEDFLAEAEIAGIRHATAEKLKVDSLKRSGFINEAGLYFEKILPNDTSHDRYTVDNKVYTVGRKFIYDYYIWNGKDSLKIAVPMTTINPDFQRDWSFVRKESAGPETIDKISFTVSPETSDQNKTRIVYEYYYRVDPGYPPFSSSAGLIENEINTWVHPHRDKYFTILALNPFPFIQKPYIIGQQWRWLFEIDDHWGDPRWQMWKGFLTIHYEYKIIGKENLQTKLGNLNCWIVEATAVSNLGTTGLIAYFNEENGFVKLDYINIDKSRVVMEIEGIR